MADTSIFDKRKWEWRLQGILERIEHEYDFILVDCPPALNAVTDNALLGCRNVLIPLRMYEKHRHSVFRVIEQVKLLEDAYDLPIEVLGVVPVGYQGYVTQEKFMQHLAGRAGELLAPALRKRETVIEKAGTVGHSLFSYPASSSYEQRAQREGQQDYLELVRFVMKRTERVLA